MFIGGKCIRDQEYGGDSKEEVKTSRNIIQNPCENDGLDYSAERRNKEKRKNVRTFGAWMLVITERVVSGLSN